MFVKQTKGEDDSLISNKSNNSQETSVKPSENTLVTNGEVVTLVDTQHFERLLDQTKSNGHSIFFDFTANWCGPCRAISPVFTSLAANNTNAVFVKVDVDKHQEVSKRCKISAMPTFQVFKNGEKTGEVLGARKKELIHLVEINV